MAATKSEEVTIKVRMYGGTYIARAMGKTASATMGAQAAAERLAMKLAGRYKGERTKFESTGIALTGMGHSIHLETYVARWDVR